MKINIANITKKRTVTRDEGEIIQKIITDAWDKEDKFIINFNHVLVASVSFMDEAFGMLALKHTKDDLKNKLKIENIVDYDRALLNDILQSRFRQGELAFSVLHDAPPAIDKEGLKMQ